MITLPEALRAALRANAATPDADPCPLLKLFSPLGAQTWLATELMDDGDTLFGLVDLGFGCPEPGSFSLREITGLHLPFGLRIERDIVFVTLFPLSVWAEEARRAGSIMAAEAALVRRLSGFHAFPNPGLPPDH